MKNNQGNQYKSQQESRIESFLKDKKIKPQLSETNDKQKVKEFIDRKLFTSANDNKKPNILAKLYANIYVRVQNIPRFIQFHRKGFMMFKKETMPLCFFVFFTTYILYKMESTQNNIQRTIIINKSFKQQQIEDEENEIATQLMGTKIDTLVPIGDQAKKNNIYKFENFDENGNNEDGMFGFSTKQQMVKDIIKEKQDGLSVPQQFKKDVNQYEIKNLYKNMKKEMIQKKKEKENKQEVDSVFDH